VSTVVPGVVNHREVRAPASGMVPLPFGSATSRRFVPCVFARVVTAKSASRLRVTRTKEVGGVPAPPAFTPSELGWL
jgi:hypothetical protein